MLRKLAFVAFLASVCSSPVEYGIGENIVGVVSECIDNDTSLCLKLAITKDLNILDGLSLVNTGSARSARSYEPLSVDPKERESQLEERIVDNVGDFLDNHVLQLRLSDDAGESRDLDEEGRGKKKNKKKLKQLLPILLLLKLKMAALIPLFLGIIAFVAVKAVFLGKIAFAVSAVSLIRRLLAKNSGASAGANSYAPAHAEENPGYSYKPAQGWSRTVNDAQNMAYAGQLTSLS
ncbi:unnamed protein product [Leptidea sinapis]|uniref:Osiris 7 n=1 Tax=Leptidea sinapis TaxID=189913 RepID=A0A5E4PWB6_9NEOP|nr:unnamed protein product [Leptidea sinapis]